MKIWLIGAKGMLGSAFLNYLLDKPIAVVATTRKEVDITSKEAIANFANLHSFTHIINCAAYTAVDEAEEKQQLAFAVNTLGPGYLADIAKEKDINIMHFSTDYVFDGTTNKPYLETDKPNPCNIYGKTKAEGEVQVASYRKSCIIRTSWLFGIQGKNFVSNILNKMATQEEVFVVDDQIGRPTFCTDLVECAVVLLDHQGIFHFANKEATSWYELAKTIYEEAKQLGYSMKCLSIKPIKTIDYPTLAKRPNYSILDTTKLEQLLHLMPRPWKEALQDYLKQYLSSLW